MSATSGIGVSPDLAQKFSVAVDAKDIRFVKISIRNESLVHDVSEPVSGSFLEDLPRLQVLLEDDVPAYVLVRLDEPSTEWLAVFYVPINAKVRDKMLYAATRNSLTKSLGSSLFTDSIFATSKEDITPQGYVGHKAHMAAPKPLTPREQEMEDLKAAERATAGSALYEGRFGLQGPLSANSATTGVGLNWSPDVEGAVKDLRVGDGGRLVVIHIDPSSETLVLGPVSDVSPDEIGSALPPSEPAYAFFAWQHSYNSAPKREIVFIYSCPSSSPVKHRMLYSSGSSSVFQYAKSLFSLSSPNLASRKIETSDPKELDEAYLRSELGLTRTSLSDNPTGGNTDEKKPFARPKGPGRKR